MGIFNNSSGVIKPISQRITINGGASAALECVSISRDTAEFEVPELLYDSLRERYRDGFVTVHAGDLFEDGGASVWAGYLDTDSAAEGESEDSVKFSGISITGYLNKVWVGQTKLRPVVVYTLSKKFTCRDILIDLFDNLPTFLKTRIKLGSTSVLDGTLVIVPEEGEELKQTPPTVTFRSATYASALDQITGYFGDVAYRLRYVGQLCYLDFYRVQNATAPRTVVNVGNWGESPLESNVYGITSACTSRDAVTRVMVYGGPKQAVISCFSYDANPLTVLLQDWDPALEALVVANPDRAKPGAAGFLSGMEHVGRRFQLPELLRNLTKLKELPFKNTAGTPYGAQAWYYPTLLVDDPVNLSVKTGELELDPILRTGVKWELDKNQVTFKDPVFNITHLDVDSKGKPKATYAKAPVGITIAIELDEYLLHDTGHYAGSDVDLDFARSAGLTDSISREDQIYAQYTTHGIDLLSDGGPQPFFNAVIFSEDPVADLGEGGQIIPRGKPFNILEAVVIRDDSPTLRKMASDILQEKSKRRRSYSITIPYFTTAYREGYRCRVEGDASYVPDNYCITSVSYDLTEDHSTMLEIDNVKPPARQEVTL